MKMFIGQIMFLHYRLQNFKIQQSMYFHKESNKKKDQKPKKNCDSKPN